MFNNKTTFDKTINYSLAESLHKDFFENNPLPIWYYDLSTWKFLTVNKAAVNFFGFSKEEFSRMTMKDLHPEEDWNSLLDNMNKFNEAEPQALPLTYRLKNGNIVSVSLSCHNIHYEGHAARAVVLQNSHALKAETTHENQISVRFDIGLGIGKFASWEIELTSGKIIYDERIDNFFREYSKGYKTFNDFLTMLHPDDLIKMKQAAFDLIDGKISSFDIEYRVKADRNTYRWFRDIGGLVERSRRDEVIRIMGISEDINDRKKHEQELVAAKENAEEINRIKSLFFANMSHELRTPLTSILGYTELLYEEIQNQEHKQMLDSVFLSGQRLLETFNEILQISKIESQKLVPNFEKVLLPQIIGEVLSHYQSTIERKGLYSKINYSCDDLYAYVDREMFDTVISNLVSNAIKFTQSGGVTINCNHQGLDEKDQVRIEISDTGIGLSSHDDSLVFEEFRQVSDGFEKLYEGTGLGLTIVKKFTEAMGGKISVVSEVNQGTTFILDFPAIQLEGLQQVVNEDLEVNNDVELAVDTQQDFPSVLLVEDDVCNSEVVNMYLSNICNLDIARCGEDAIRVAKKKHYDAILMDIGLGAGISGLETAKKIRQFQGYETTPIIAVTAYASLGDKEKFLAEGLSDYISKPFKNYELISKLNKALNKKEN